MTFMVLTGITGITAFSAGIMVMAIVIILFLCWTLPADYIYANVINESVGWTEIYVNNLISDVIIS